MIRIVNRLEYADGLGQAGSRWARRPHRPHGPHGPNFTEPATLDPEPLSMKAAMELIDAERLRLIKRFLPQHDGGRLIGAAWSYRTAPGPRSPPPQIWPWHVNAWRPSSRLQNLVKAGAYFLAEAQRLEQRGEDPREIQEVRGLVMSVAREIQKHRDAAAHHRTRCRRQTRTNP